jgi:hypothetical protein
MQTRTAARNPRAASKPYQAISQNVLELKIRNKRWTGSRHFAVRTLSLVLLSAMLHHRGNVTIG